jgi:hypothetical protein
MPSQFKNRGDRLVFSNGVIVLAVLAGALIYAFDANLSRLIQLYVVGVFTSFTLSQAGMVRHWLKERTRGGRSVRGWRRSIVINGVGAATTGIVLVVITATKFLHGAWIVIVSMPFIVLGLLAVHRHYQHVLRALHARELRLDRAATHRFLFLVRDLGPATHEALAQIRALRPRSVTPLYVGKAELFPAIAKGWTELAGRFGPLERLPGHGHGTIPALRERLGAEALDEHTFVTVVIPELVSGTSWWHLLWRQRFAFFLKARLLFSPDLAVMDIPLVPKEQAEASERSNGEFETGRSVVLVPVSAVHDGTIRAVNYARALASTHLEALYFAADPEVVGDIADEWWDSGIDVPLSFVEAPFRDLGPPLLEEIRRYTARPDTVVTVVIPEFLVTRWWEHLLHGQTALFIKRLLLAEPNTVVVSVPYRVPMTVGAEGLEPPNLRLVRARRTRRSEH